jgi:C-terminal processing protease CtpA/Prc
MASGKLTVANFADQSAAQTTGKVGDVILAVDGEPIAQRTPRTCRDSGHYQYGVRLRLGFTQLLRGAKEG